MPDGADLVRLVRFEAVQRVSVLVREHCDRACAQFERRTEGADGDLAAVGNQDFLEH